MVATELLPSTMPLCACANICVHCQPWFQHKIAGQRLTAFGGRMGYQEGVGVEVNEGQQHTAICHVHLHTLTPITLDAQQHREIYDRHNGDRLTDTMETMHSLKEQVELLHLCLPAAHLLAQVEGGRWLPS